MKIDFRKNAEDKLKDIRIYYEERSQSVADKIINDLYNDIKSLANFPQMAPIEPLLSDAPVTVRSLVVRGIFKVIYFVDEEQEIINILTIWDCRQDDKRMSEEVVI